jgi:MurNAc alpha-1-phosphate uridylyltransferase
MIETAMVLAAGRGTRLRPLTDRTPKPLLEIGGRSLLEHHLARLANAGVRRVVINLHHLGDQIRARLGRDADLGLELHYSEEPELLETAGGIHAALPLLGDAPFLVISADVFTDHDPATLPVLAEDTLAHLVLIPNPPWRSGGDFALAPGPAGAPGRLHLAADAPYTYAGVGVFRPAFFAGMRPGPLPLRPLLDAAIADGRVTGEPHAGLWEDIGTPERLAAARARVSA